MIKENKLAVVYLSWLPYGIHHLQEFIHSYKKFDPGFPHRLIILFNGVAHEHDKTPFLDLVRDQLPEANIHEVQTGQDIEAYFDVARTIEEEYAVFFNTYTRYNCDNWLRNYIQAFDQEIGIVGGSGSYQSLYSTVFQTLKWNWEKEKSIKEHFTKYKMLVKAAIYWRMLIPPYPNPHIRTTGFMLRTKDFLSLEKRRMTKKFDAYLFENGRNSMTRQMQKRGYRVVVAGRDGKRYEVEQWKDSRIFWKQEQENLMVSDNQTEMYRTSDENYRKYLRHLAWGDK